MGKRMDDWLRNMDDWNISRRRYYGLPLPFYPCSCGHLNVIGSKAELAERAVEGLDQLQELRRPWIDRVPIRCEDCGEPVTRVTEVGDVWLDAGIVPFSTLGWQSPEWIEQGYATGAAKGLTTADLPGQRLLGEVVPGRLGERDARADPALVLLAVLHVGRARRPLAVQARARLREDARRARARDARLVGEHDRRRGRVRPDGGRRDALAVLRAAARPEPALRLRAGARDHPQAADVLALGQVLRRLREHRGLRARAGRSRGPRRRPDAARPLARRADARARARGRGSLRGDADRERDARLRRVRRRPLELVHPPLAPPLLRRRPGRVPDALVRPRPVVARDRAGDAVPRRPPLVEARSRPRGLGPPLGLARGGRPRPRPARRRSPRFARSSSSAARRAPRPASSCASRCAG